MVKMMVTAYCPRSENGIAAATAAIGSSFVVIANTADIMPPITALGGCAPPTGMFPMVIS